MRFLFVLAVMAEAWAQGNDASSPEGIESTGLLEQIKQRVIQGLAGVPNYVCVDSIERSLWIPGERQFRRLDRMHIEVAHIEGADRFSWLGNSTFNSRNPATMVGYGASFGGSFADNRALVFKSNRTRISYAGHVTVNSRPALRYEYDAPRGALRLTNGNLSGYTAARGSFWIDPETLDLLQIDVEAYAIPSELAVRSTSDHTMYWRVLIGQRIVLLAQSADFRLTTADGILKRNTSVFSNCREYTADSTLIFGSSPTLQVLPPPVEKSRIQPGLQLQLALDKTLDSQEAAVGDPIRAHVLQGEGDIPRRSRLRTGEPHHQLQRLHPIAEAGTPAAWEGGDAWAAFR